MEMEAPPARRRGIPALVPIRDGSLLSELHQSKLKRRKPNPYILLPTVDNESAASVTIGRAELLLTTSSACSCLCNAHLPPHNAADSIEKNQSIHINSTPRLRQRPSCKICTGLEQWAIRYISRKMLRFEHIAAPLHSGSEGGGSECTNISWTATSLGQNSARIIYVDGVRLSSDVTNTHKSVETKTKDDQVQNMAIMKVGSILMLKCPLSSSQSLPCLPSTLYQKYDHKKREELDDGSAKNLCNTMEFIVTFIDESIQDSPLENIRTIHESNDKNNIRLNSKFSCNTEEKRSSKHQSATLKQNSNIESLVQTEGGINIGDQDDHIGWDNNSQHDREQHTSTLNRKKGSALLSKEGYSNIKLELQKESFIPKDGNFIQNNETVKCAVLFLARGKAMSKSRIKLLSASIMKNEDVEVLERFDSQRPPTHIVVDATISVNDLSSSLGFLSLAVMAKVFEKIYIVTPDWATHFQHGFEKPTMNQCWSRMHELRRELQRKDRKYESPDHQLIPPWITRKRRYCDFAPISKIPASAVQNTVIAKMRRERKVTPINVNRGNNAGKQINVKLSKFFETISTLYKECPLDQFDEWRSYSYFIVSRRLRQLDFEVDSDPIALQRLSQVNGFGSKIMKQCKEYLVSGTCQLIHQFENDPMRKGVRNIIRIWGIGAKKSLDLVGLGYASITSVRKGLDCQALELDERARIGIQYYEDFQEKMDRDEVRQISQIVESACRVKYAEAEISTMGSYRRGNSHCGDVDIMITHPKYVTSTPTGALDELVERLRRSGHISDHLTKVNASYSLSYTTRCDRAASYMGVFVSPVFPSKRRRLDIKFYPYRERAFASLYFTGNSFFNRSMRLFSKRRKMALNDHGLFSGDSGRGHGTSLKRIRIEAKTESDIFDALGLVYREPHERDSFDAVTEVSTCRPVILGCPDQAEILSESRHRWID